MKKIVTGIFSGDLILNKNLMREYRFIIFIFLLVILYISKNFAMERILLSERANTRTLKNIKADYTSKAAKLLELSKIGEVERLLNEKQSTLRRSENAPSVVITGKR